jgi:hypothetical protein
MAPGRKRGKSFLLYFLSNCRTLERLTISRTPACVKCSSARCFHGPSWRSISAMSLAIGSRSSSLRIGPAPEVSTARLPSQAMVNRPPWPGHTHSPAHSGRTPAPVAGRKRRAAWPIWPTIAPPSARSRIGISTARLIAQSPSRNSVPCASR